MDATYQNTLCIPVLLALKLGHGIFPPLSYPFSSCRFELASPFMIRDGKGRSLRFQKVYLCLFVCLAIKAMCTAAFIITFRRFIARRGVPSPFSDNGKIEKIARIYRTKRFSKAGVRSVKHHPKRVFANASLAFEEMYALFTQLS